MPFMLMPARIIAQVTSNGCAVRDRGKVVLAHFNLHKTASKK